MARPRQVSSDAEGSGTKSPGGTSALATYTTESGLPVKMLRSIFCNSVPRFASVVVATGAIYTTPDEPMKASSLNGVT